MAKLDEGRVHLIISIILGVVVALTVIGAIIAIRMRLFGTDAPSPTPPMSAAMPSSSASSLPSEPVSSMPEEPSSSPQSSEPAPSAPPSSQEASSELETSSEEDLPAYDPAFPGVRVMLYADGQTQELTPEQVDEFMNLYLLVDIVYVRSEDNTELNAVSTGGFLVAYPDGRQEGYRIGEIYDGTWWAGNDFYEVDGHALELEEYLYQYPIIQNWLNRAHEAGLIIS